MFTQRMIDALKTQRLELLDCLGEYGMRIPTRASKWMKCLSMRPPPLQSASISHCTSSIVALRRADDYRVLGSVRTRGSNTLCGVSVYVPANPDYRDWP